MHCDGLIHGAARAAGVFGVVVACMAARAELLVLDNGGIRVEFDSDLCALRYVGAPGAKNLIAAFHVPHRVRKAHAATVDPGGMGVYVLREGTPIRVDGPCEVEAHDERAFSVLSTAVAGTDVRIRLTCRLDAAAPEGGLRVSFQTTSEKTQELGLILRTVLAPEAVLRLAKADATIRAVMPERLSGSLLVDSGEYWTVDSEAADRAPDASGTLDAESTSLEMVGDGHALRRTAIGRAATADHPRIQYRRDGAARQRVVDWLYPVAGIDLWNQPPVTESWTMSTVGD